MLPLGSPVALYPMNEPQLSCQPARSRVCIRIRRSSWSGAVTSQRVEQCEKKPLKKSAVQSKKYFATERYIPHLIRTTCPSVAAFTLADSVIGGCSDPTHTCQSVGPNETGDTVHTVLPQSHMVSEFHGLRDIELHFPMVQWLWEDQVYNHYGGLHLSFVVKGREKWKKTNETKEPKIEVVSLLVLFSHRIESTWNSLSPRTATVLKSASRSSWSVTEEWKDSRDGLFTAQGRQTARVDGAFPEKDKTLRGTTNSQPLRTDVLGC